MKPQQKQFCTWAGCIHDACRWWYSMPKWTLLVFKDCSSILFKNKWDWKSTQEIFIPPFPDNIYLNNYLIVAKKIYLSLGMVLHLISVILIHSFAPPLEQSIWSSVKLRMFFSYFSTRLSLMCEANGSIMRYATTYQWQPYREVMQFCPGIHPSKQYAIKASYTLQV